MLERPRIIDVTRKPAKCPVCGGQVVDIIYGTGDMTEADFLLEYRQDGYMGGDNIPRRPPIWACSCGCKRFRKVNPDGTDCTSEGKNAEGCPQKASQPYQLDNGDGKHKHRPEKDDAGSPL